MNGLSFLVDTNVALYLLSGNKTITETLNHSTVYVSFVTQLELLGYKGISESEITKVKRFLKDCIIMDLTEEIKNNTIKIKQQYNIKLPDSIIAATAEYLEIPLLTADIGFQKIKDINITFYKE